VAANIRDVAGPRMYPSGDRSRARWNIHPNVCRRPRARGQAVDARAGITRGGACAQLITRRPQTVAGC